MTKGSRYVLSAKMPGARSPNSGGNGPGYFSIAFQTTSFRNPHVASESFFKAGGEGETPPNHNTAVRFNTCHHPTTRLTCLVQCQPG